MSASIRRGVLVLLAGMMACALGRPARADEAGVRRLTAALGRIDDAAEPLSVLFTELQGLEGLKLSDADGPGVRRELGDEHPAIRPLADALRSLTIEGGVLRLTLERPVVLKLKRGVIALAPDTSLRVRSSPQGDLAVDQTRGLEVGRSTSLTLPLRRVTVSTVDGKRVGKAEVMIGFFPKTITFDAPTPGLVGAVAPAR